jgi:hypothetical protein
MNHIIEQQKERAREKAKNSDFDASHEGVDDGFCMTYEDLDILITQTHQATIAECVRIAEGMKRLEMNDDYDGGYNHACDDLIEALTKKVDN